jgi:N-acetylneuraminic acid mutarotase
MKKHFFTILFSLLLFSGISQSTWTAKASYPSGGVEGTLSIGNDVYVLGGWGDFWKWESTTNSWIRKADFPREDLSYIATFSIGNKGYVGTGEDQHGNIYTDFWEYDSTNDLWIRKADHPSGGLAHASGFSIGHKGYFVGGYSSGPDSHIPKLWEWDQSTNTWSQKATCPSGFKSAAVAFSIGSKGYFGLGRSLSGPTNDFWEWDQINDSWQQLNNFPGQPREEPSGFSIGARGYVGLGVDNTIFYKDFWEWDPNTQIWIQLPDLPGNSRCDAIQAATTGNKGYIGAGRSVNASSPTDFYEFTPSPVGLIEFQNIQFQLSPNPATESLLIKTSTNITTDVCVYDILGNCLLIAQMLNSSEKQIDLRDFTKGIYFVELKTGKKSLNKKIIIN